MTKATELELATMHGEIAKGLTKALRDGVPMIVGKGEDAEVVTAPAPAAYYMAAITFAKNNNITADAAGNADLEALHAALATRRAKSKAAMNKRTVDQVAEQFERDLGGHLQ